jgi:GMP synthase (glutamine-hydrolysing)
VSTARVLVVEHEQMCPPAWVGEWLVGAGAELDLRRPYTGDALPDDLTDHDVFVVLGGSMGANDDADFPWLTRVKHLVRRAATTEVPTLGICLGHQLGAVALGGRVERNPRGQQVGVLDVGWTADAGSDPLLGPVAAAARPARPTRAVQWNNDLVVETPPGTAVLAQTPHDEVQAARFAPTVWGVQWHPEAGEDVVRVWAEKDRDDAAERGVDLEGYVAAVGAARDEMRATWPPLARLLVGLAAARAARAAGTAR